MQWLSLSSYGTDENADVKRCAALCTSISSATFKLLCSLCAPEEPEDCTFMDLNSLTEYLSELRRLSLSCEWPEAYLKENLQDKFVMGIYNKRLLQQLLTQEHTKSLDEMFQLAATMNES